MFHEDSCVKPVLKERDISSSEIKNSASEKNEINSSSFS